MLCSELVLKLMLLQLSDAVLRLEFSCVTSLYSGSFIIAVEKFNSPSFFTDQEEWFQTGFQFHE